MPEIPHNFLRDLRYSATQKFDQLGEAINTAKLNANLAHIEGRHLEAAKLLTGGIARPFLQSLKDIDLKRNKSYTSSMTERLSNEDQPTHPLDPDMQMMSGEVYQEPGLLEQVVVTAALSGVAVCDFVSKKTRDLSSFISSAKEWINLDPDRWNP